MVMVSVEDSSIHCPSQMRVIGHLVLFYVHQVNEVNFPNDFVIMTVWYH